MINKTFLFKPHFSVTNRKNATAYNTIWVRMQNLPWTRCITVASHDHLTKIAFLFTCNFNICMMNIQQKCRPSWKMAIVLNIEDQVSENILYRLFVRNCLLGSTCEYFTEMAAILKINGHRLESWRGMCLFPEKWPLESNCSQFHAFYISERFFHWSAALPR